MQEAGSEVGIEAGKRQAMGLALRQARGRQLGRH